MKIATLGPVIGMMTQDRATAVGGTLGAGPRELEVNITLTSAARRRAAVQVLGASRPGADAALRLRRASQLAGRLRAAVRRADGRGVAAPSRSAPTARSTIDDVFTGETTVAAGGVGRDGAVRPRHERVPGDLPERLDLTLRVARAAGEHDDRTRLARHHQAEAGATHTLQVHAPRLPRRHRDRRRCRSRCRRRPTAR